MAIAVLSPPLFAVANAAAAVSLAFCAAAAVAAAASDAFLAAAASAIAFAAAASAAFLAASYVCLHLVIFASLFFQFRKFSRLTLLRHLLHLF